MTDGVFVSSYRCTVAPYVFNKTDRLKRAFKTVLLSRRQKRFGIFPLFFHSRFSFCIPGRSFRAVGSRKPGLRPAGAREGGDGRPRGEGFGRRCSSPGACASAADSFSASVFRNRRPTTRRAFSCPRGLDPGTRCPRSLSFHIISVRLVSSPLCSTHLPFGSARPRSRVVHRLPGYFGPAKTLSAHS